MMQTLGITQDFLLVYFSISFLILCSLQKTAEHMIYVYASGMLCVIKILPTIDSRPAARTMPLIDEFFMFFDFVQP